MYTIHHNKTQQIIEVSNPKKSLYGKIVLNQGASLQELMIDKNKIIQDLSPLTYNNTYASSILFPFANRVKDGKYTFNGNEFQLETNQQEEHNALHGLVYDKTFKIATTETTENSAKIVLSYSEVHKNIGFPFTYNLKLTYIFKENTVSLTLDIKNTDSETFPFTLGWHPYFTSEDLSKSTLKFDCKQELIIGDRNITTGVTDVNKQVILQIEEKQLDDCWALHSDKFVFTTPSYQLVFSSNEKDNFMQAYTPPRKNTIAIEPTTGVSDSFNNKIGLKELKPTENYAVTWNVKVESV